VTIRIVSGRPDDDEIAALLAVLHIALQRKERPTVHLRPQHDWRRPALFGAYHSPASWGPVPQS
jgi:hypothetical protein